MTIPFSTQALLTSVEQEAKQKEAQAVEDDKAAKRASEDRWRERVGLLFAIGPGSNRASLESGRKSVTEPEFGEQFFVGFFLGKTSKSRPEKRHKHKQFRQNPPF